MTSSSSPAVLVPREPTEAMLDAFWHGEGESQEMRARSHARGRRQWSAMIEALASSPKTAIPAPADGQVASQREVVAWRDLNVNDTVKVKLTDLGREIHKAYWEPFSAGHYLPPKVDVDGFSDFQLWDLMATFGHKIRMGMNVPFETTIRVNVPSPTDQSSDVSGLVDAGRLLEVLREQSWDLRCFSVPTGGDDYDIGWRVVGHWQAEPRERTIAEVFHDDPAEAIREALAQANQVKP